jgi:hypothetical protein
MNPYRYIQWLIVAVLVLTIPACSPSSTPPPVADATQSVEGESSPTAAATEVSVTEALTTAPPESAGACDNPYLPVVAGATWNYKLTGTVSDSFTHTILSVESDSFVEQDQFGTGVTRQGTWQCDNGDLIALNPTTGSSANVSTEGVSVDFETTAQSGVTLPATINPGDTWTQSLTLEGTQTISGISYEASNQFSNSCTAVGIESVTVEAGTFDAMRVECQTDMNISIALDPNNPISTPLSAKNIYWYAEDIGMVKNTTSGIGIESTIELVSYNIP